MPQPMILSVNSLRFFQLRVSVTPWLTKSGLYTFGERPEIADALKFVVRQLDVEMLFEPR